MIEQHPNQISSCIKIDKNIEISSDSKIDLGTIMVPLIIGMKALINKSG
jgi:hypothetical protein